MGLSVIPINNRAFSGLSGGVRNSETAGSRAKRAAQIQNAFQPSVARHPFHSGIASWQARVVERGFYFLEGSGRV